MTITWKLGTTVLLSVIGLALSCSPATSSDGGPGSDGGRNDGGNPGCSRCNGAICLPDGGCGACLGDVDCGGASPRCDPATNTCVACLADATDNCPTGEYCLPSESCTSGCKDDTSCGLGSCGSTHECTPCAADGECTTGRLCQQGQCGPPCSASNLCSGALSCCTGHCTNTSSDPFNCGTCGVACGGGAFCNGVACKSVGFQSTCAEATAIVLQDSQVPDQNAGSSIGSALQAGCPGMSWVAMPEGADAGVNPASGRPAVGAGTLLVAAGGPFVQKLVSYLETSASGIWFNSDTNNYYFAERDGGNLASALKTTSTANHDFFLLELVKDPTTGTLSLVCYGFQSPGTAAGAWYFAHTVLPQSASSTASWYVVEWTDTNGNSLPDAADAFAVRASGP